MFEFLIFLVIVGTVGFLIASPFSPLAKRDTPRFDPGEPYARHPSTPVVIPPVKPQVPVPYKRRNRLMSHAEGSFFQVLEMALPEDQYRLFGKVRVEDLIVVKSGLTREGRQSARNRIRSRHVDIVVVDSKTFAPVWAIELDDKSHQARDRQDRDEFMDRAFEAAGLPLIRFPAKRGYSREFILSTLGLSDTPDKSSEPIAAGAESSSEESEPFTDPVPGAAPEPGTCSRCYAPMKIRNIKGAGGKTVQVKICSRYPKCRRMVPLEAS